MNLNIFHLIFKLTSEERETRSLGDSRVSGCRLSESHESEVGVSGRALCDL